MPKLPKLVTVPLTSATVRSLDTLPAKSPVNLTNASLVTLISISVESVAASAIEDEANKTAEVIIF